MNNRIILFVLLVLFASCSVHRDRERELKGLKTAAQITGCKNLLLLTDHEYEDTTFEGFGIQIRPVHEWQ